MRQNACVRTPGDAPTIRIFGFLLTSRSLAATAFDLKGSLGHLRSFLERLHSDASTAVHKRIGGISPSKWGDVLKDLHDNSVLSKQEEQFVAAFYRLMSDAGVHPLIAEREYARLMRNMSIEYGLLILTKMEKLGYSL